MNDPDGQWAKVYGWVFSLGLDATALNVLGIMAAKAGRERVVWSLSQEDIGRLVRPDHADGPLDQTTISRAQKRLERKGCIERVGKRIVHPKTGGYRQLWRIVDTPPDQQDMRAKRISGGDDAVQDMRPGVRDMRLGVQDMRPGRLEDSQSPGFSTHSSVEATDVENRNPEPSTDVDGLVAGIGDDPEQGAAKKVQVYFPGRRHHNPEPAVQPNTQRIACRVEGCDRFNVGRNYCADHTKEQIAAALARVEAE